MLKVQQMLHECAEHLEKDADHQAVAALSIAMITMGEEVGAEVRLRAEAKREQKALLPSLPSYITDNPSHARFAPHR